MMICGVSTCGVVGRRVQDGDAHCSVIVDCGMQRKCVHEILMSVFMYVRMYEAILCHRTMQQRTVGMEELRRESHLRRTHRVVTRKRQPCSKCSAFKWRPNRASVM